MFLYTSLLDAYKTGKTTIPKWSAREMKQHKLDKAAEKEFKVNITSTGSLRHST
jgi:hypothetical protein